MTLIPTSFLFVCVGIYCYKSRTKRNTVAKTLYELKQLLNNKTQHSSHSLSTYFELSARFWKLTVITTNFIVKKKNPFFVRNSFQSKDNNVSSSHSSHFFIVCFQLAQSVCSTSSSHLFWFHSVFGSYHKFADCPVLFNSTCCVMFNSESVRKVRCKSKVISVIKIRSSLK